MRLRIDRASRFTVEAVVSLEYSDETPRRLGVLRFYKNYTSCVVSGIRREVEFPSLADALTGLMASRGPVLAPDFRQALIAAAVLDFEAGLQ